jgi:hypothetical protein
MQETCSLTSSYSLISPIFPSDLISETFSSLPLSIPLNQSKLLPLKLQDTFQSIYRNLLLFSLSTVLSHSTVQSEPVSQKHVTVSSSMPSNVEANLSTLFFCLPELLLSAICHLFKKSSQSSVILLAYFYIFAALTKL